MPTETNSTAEPQSRYAIIPGFSCLEMKQQGQELLQHKLAGLTEEEIQAYWDARHAELLAWQAEAKQKYVEPAEPLDE